MKTSMNMCGLALPENIENQVLLIERMVRDHYFPDRDRNFPDWLLVFAIAKVLELKPKASPDEILETMIDPTEIESAELRREIHTAIADCRKRNAGHNWNDIGIFTGARGFAAEKLAGMAAYLSAQGGICLEKLNGLLFYSDFVHYWLHGESISGSRYVRSSDGPGQEFFGKNIDSLIKEGVVKVDRSGSKHHLVPAKDSLANDLSVNELTTLHWIRSTFGSMSQPEIGDHIRQESSYKFTRRGDFIAYEYSKLFKVLPQPSAT
jgi:hypothetical protein